MNCDEFEALFRGNIRVLFDWTLLRSANYPVRPRLLRHPTEWSAWLTPWYAAGDAGEDYLRGEAPLRFSAVAENPGVLTARRQEKLRAIAADLRRSPHALLVAAYDYGAGTIVLDGNHRLAAAIAFGGEQPALAITVSGPADPAILPDLANVPGRRPVS